MQNRHSPPPPLFQATVKEAAAAGPALMAKLVAALRRDLHGREGAARDFREREVHADSLRQLFAHEAILGKGFEAALMEQFTKPVDTPRTSMPSIADVQFDQLELMDELQVQESVNMARAQQMVMLAAEASLSELNALMCAALGLPTVRPERNPLRPEAYIQALRNTVERTPAPSSMRLDWLTVMGTALGSELQVLYRDLVVRLRAQGVVAASYAVSQSATPGVGAAGFKRAEGAGSAQVETTRYGAPGSAEREALIAQEFSRPKPVVDPGLLTLDRLRLLLAGELDSAGTTHRVAAFAKQFERDFESPQAGYRAHEAEPTDFAATVPAAFEALAEMRQVDRVVQRLEQRVDLREGGIVRSAGRRLGAGPVPGRHARCGRAPGQRGPAARAAVADAAEPIRNPARAGTAQRADQRPEEDVLQRVHIRESDLGQQREACRIADEAAEGADIQDAHQPILRAAKDH